jgi:hypothetical protein
MGRVPTGELFGCLLLLLCGRSSQLCECVCTLLWLVSHFMFLVLLHGHLCVCVCVGI